MYAPKWKFKLLKKYKIKFLPKLNINNDDVQKDIKRTYPQLQWFHPHYEEIQNIILNFVDMNPALSYMQGMCFITFTFFYVFRHSDYRGCETLYCLHKIVEPIRPIYPLNRNDKKPLKFIQSLKKLVLLDIYKQSRELSVCLEKMHIIDVFIISGVPSFFGNWYGLQGSIRLFDRLIEDNPSKIVQNIVLFLTCFFLYHKEIILKCSFTQTMHILQQKGNLSNILLLMQAKKKK